MKPKIVWLIEERCFARLTRRDAYFSIVEYTQNGIDYEVQVENDDYDDWEDDDDDTE